MSACVSAVSRLVQEGYQVTLVDIDGSPLGEPIDGGDTTGVELLAIALATVTARRDLPTEALARLVSGTSTGPLVLVTGAIDDADAAALAPVPHHSSLPVLLSVSAHQSVLAHAAETGWRVAAIPPDADLAAAWNGVVDRRGTHVGA